MSIYRPKGSAHWYYDIQIDGLRLRRSTRQANRGAAEAIEARLRTELASGAYFKRRPPITLDQAFCRFYDEHGRFLASARQIDYQLGNLLSLGKDALLSEIGDDEIAAWVAVRRAGLANATVNREIELLRRVYRRAARVWKAEVGEMPDWRAHRLPEADERVRELSRDEEAALFEALRPDFHALVRCCLITGLRLMTAARLTWPQVDFKGRMIVYRSKSRRPGGKRHVLPLTSEALVLLANERGNHEEMVFTYVCRRSRGMRRKGERYPFTRNGWRKAWKVALAEAGIADFRFHDLRHTAATRVLRQTGNLRLVQRLLGHANIATTARYSHVTQDDLRAALEATARQASGRAAAAEKLKD